MMVSEGYYATKSAYNLNQGYGAKTPIIDAVYLYMKEKMANAL
jgi:glycerol-3-phosphate dehydrogenase (NAD(P)+)